MEWTGLHGTGVSSSAQQERDKAALKKATKGNFTAAILEKRMHRTIGGLAKSHTRTLLENHKHIHLVTHRERDRKDP